MKALHKNVRADRGAALATVLMMLAIMSALAVVAVDAANMSLRRTINQTQMEQARWYLLGAENFAANKIVDLVRRSDAARIDQDEWQARAFTFPLDEGVMTVTLWDGSNCFNLNSLVVQSEDGMLMADAGGQVQFARLLDLLDVRGVNTMSLVATLADWIDADSQPGAGGVEDSGYADGPYRVGNTLLADLSEVRRVRGFDEATIDRIAPYACVRPVGGAIALNPNTLRPNQAVLLSMVLGSTLSPSAAEDVIRSRPRGGWADLDDFFANPRLAGMEITEQTRAYFDMSSRYYVAVISVQYRDARETSAALIEARGESARVVRRVFGAGGWEHAV